MDDDFDVDDLINQIESDVLGQEHKEKPKETEAQGGLMPTNKSSSMTINKSKPSNSTGLLPVPSTATPERSFKMEIENKESNPVKSKKKDDWLGISFDEDDTSEREAELMASLGFSRQPSSISSEQKLHKENKEKVTVKPPDKKKALGSSQMKNKLLDFPVFGRDSVLESSTKTDTRKGPLPAEEQFKFSSKPPSPHKKDDAADSETGGRPKSIFDALNFLNTQSKDADAERTEQKRTEQSTESSTTKKAPGTGKKKAAKAPAVSSDDSVHATLHVPSHLIDEEELKGICSSLKVLYSHQLELLEKSYKEQVDLVSQSAQRREDLLKEELKSMQKEYDLKIDRLKKEVQEAERKENQFSKEDMNRLEGKIDKALGAIQDSKNNCSLEHHEMNISSVSKSDIATQVAVVVEAKVKDWVGSLENLSGKRASDDANIVVDKMKQTYQVQMETFTNKFEDVEKKLRLSATKSNNALANKLYKSLLQGTEETFKKTLKAYLEGTLIQFQKTRPQVKKCRKEIRQIFTEFEHKHSLIIKGQSDIAMGQKAIAKDLHNLPFMWKRQERILLPSNETGVQEAVPNQKNYETEMELKLLREERNSFSDSMAQMHVERRRISDEKILLEKDRMDLDREKNKLREAEASLRLKLNEVEDMKKSAEKNELEGKRLFHENQFRMRTIESEQEKVKESWLLLEEKFSNRERCLVKERQELLREKELLDKIKTEMLCPQCLSSSSRNWQASGDIGKNRSDGDGIDAPAPYISPIDGESFLRKPQFLDCLLKSPQY